MGKHRKGSKLVGAMDDESIDKTLRELAGKFGLTKSDLIRRFLREGIASTHQLSDWRRLAGRNSNDIDGREY